MCLKDAVREAINAYVLAIRIKRCPDHISTVIGTERLERLERLIHVFWHEPTSKTSRFLSQSNGLVLVYYTTSAKKRMLI